MGSESVMKGSVPVKDFGKKKRPNRLAKLKQCKRDAKRDQWLSQAKNNKGCNKEEPNTAAGVVSIPLSVHLTDDDDDDEPKRSLGNSEIRSRGGDGLSVRDCDVEEEFIENNSPTSSVTGSIDSNSRKGRPGSSCGSSSSCSGCYSGSISEEEEEEEDDECLDDWEAVADALTAAENKCHPPKSNLSIEKEAPVVSLIHTQVPNMGSEGGVGLKPECKKEAPVAAAAANARAWRPDDAFRPQSLPNLLKQKSFPITWSCHSIMSHQPSSCPICYEDLDLTDSSFLPCSCGFHLCLFCHKRILEADGRCPGCRKQYDPINGDTGINGEAPQKRVARSSSMTA